MGPASRMAHVLQQIVEEKYRELARRKALRPRRELERDCRAAAPARDLAAALRHSAGGVRLIAEVKRASPSGGVLTESFDPASQARAYAAHGAAAVSVLTDEKFFQGSLEHLRAVRAQVELPLLRKDFTVDEYQLWEARAAGADAVLLIVSILGPAELRELLLAAKGLGLGALVEVHTRQELEQALGAGAPIVGLNNRDLRTFETRIETTLELLPLIPPRPLGVGDSRLTTAAALTRAAAAPPPAGLVGRAPPRAPPLRVHAP